MTIILLLLLIFGFPVALALLGPRALALIILTPAALWLLMWIWIIAYNS